MLGIHPQIELLQVADTRADVGHFINRDGLAPGSPARQHGHQRQQEACQQPAEDFLLLVVGNHSASYLSNAAFSTHTLTQMINLHKRKTAATTSRASSRVSEEPWSAILCSASRIVEAAMKAH